MPENNESLVAGTRVDDAGTRSFALTSQGIHTIVRDLPPNSPSETYCWYPMYVKYCKELAVQQELESRAFKTFIPMEAYSVKKGSTVKTLVRPAVHNIIFVYSFQRRITWMKMYSGQCAPLQYMSRRRLDGRSEIITISPKAMDNFIRAATLDDPLCQRSYLDRPIDITDLDRHIRFVSGTFKGIEGVIKRVNKNRAMILPLTIGLNMKLTITSASDIEFL